MQEIIEKFMNGYKKAKQEVFANNPFGSFVRREIPQAIYELGIFDKSTYLITGSVGQGNWAMVPWVCIFNKQITTTATKGVYIDYLLSADCERLYLVFNQGCSDIRSSHTLKETIQILRTEAKKITDAIDNRGFNIDENIILGDRLTELALLYQKGAVFYKEYQIDNIPSDEELINDLRLMSEIYNDYVDMKNNNKWWPSEEEYTPGFSAAKWLEILNGPDFFEPGWANILAMFYSEKNGATCKQIGEKYGCSAQSVRGKCMQIAQRIWMRFNCPVIERDGTNMMWPIIFVGRKESSQGDEPWVWKLRPELYEALTEFEITRFLNQINEEPEAIEMTTKEKIDRIKTYIAGKGFTYDEGLIENFWLSLKSKPFVILAGTSGTGKTRLVRLFAESIGAAYKMVPVRPDWSDSSDLLGHFNLEHKEFIPGEVLKFIVLAQDDPDKTHILCLDEMNLARVEYYLSDFLSVIETRDFKDGKIVSDRLLPIDAFGDVRFPENFYLVGTVNMDETTFPFSKKVLDRANTIEFNTVDMMPPADSFDAEAAPIEVNNDFLKSEYLRLSQCMNEENRNFVESVCADLETINQVLKTNNAHVGYRVRDEIVFYMLNNEKAGLLSRDEAMDNAIMQKILPRIQGSSVSVKDMLCELFKIFAEDFTGIQTENNDTASQMLRSIETKGSKYPRSAEKIAFMVRRFDEDGFTSYWL